jgi:hypothetical protein
MSHVTISRLLLTASTKVETLSKNIRVLCRLNALAYGYDLNKSQQIISYYKFNFILFLYVLSYISLNLFNNNLS